PDQRGGGPDGFGAGGYLLLGGPGGGGGLGQRGVGGVGLGLGGPVGDDAFAGLADGADFVEEGGRAEPGDAFAPPVAGAGEPERGPGGGDVGQPAFLGQLAVGAGLAEHGQVAGGQPGQGGQVGGVAAQAEGQQPRVLGPPGGDPG